jgi:MFS family permease
MHGLRAFVTLLLGQLVSRIGTALTRFGLIVWTYQQHGGATAVALLGFSALLPAIVFGPVAGVWVDRLDRRRAMLLADLGAAASTAAFLVLHLAGALVTWHVLFGLVLAGACEAFQSPAYTAATTLMIPKRHYARAQALRSLVENGAAVLAPVLAGLLLLWLGLTGVLALDLLSFAVGVATLLAVRVPAAKATETEHDAGIGFRRELRLGFGWILRRPGLTGLTLVFTGMNGIAAMTYYATLPVLILARSGGDELALASVQTAIGAGGVAGALVASAWGGPRRKVHLVLLGATLSFVLGFLGLALGRDVVSWAAAGALATFFVPFIGAGNEAIWQAKVPPAIQGRVFSARHSLGQLLVPLGYLVGGILADRWLEPAMTVGGSLAPVFGAVIGTGPGAGVALMFAGTAILGATWCLAMYLVPAVRHVETALPDFDVQADVFPKARRAPSLNSAPVLEPASLHEPVPLPLT